MFQQISSFHEGSRRRIYLKPVLSEACDDDMIIRFKKRSASIPVKIFSGKKLNNFIDVKENITTIQGL